MHRTTGKVEEVGKPEEWLKIPKTRRAIKSKPAKLCLTIFGGWKSVNGDVEKQPEAPINLPAEPVPEYLPDEMSTAPHKCEREPLLGKGEKKFKGE